MKDNHQFKLKGRQAGATAILVSLVILTLITFVSLFTAKTVNMEQKIASNDVRSKMAFEAAEAGLEAGLVYLEAGLDHTGDGTIADEVIFTSAGIVSTVYDASGDVNNMTLPNGSTVTVTMTSDASGNVVKGADNFYITSVGVSDDGTATRSITQTVGTDDPISTAPNTPFTARSTLTVSGSATIHNPEGFGTIVTGGTASVTSGSVSTRIASKASANWPACSGGLFPCVTGSYTGCTGDTAATGPSGDTTYVKCDVVSAVTKEAGSGDIIDGETTLAGFSTEEFFEATFGVTKAYFKANVATHVIDAADYGSAYPVGALNATNQIIWVNGSVTSNNVDVGCSASTSSRGSNTDDSFDVTCPYDDLGPVIMIVDGDYNPGGANTVFGLLYVLGDVGGGAGTEVQGAIVVEDSASVSGSLDVWFDSGILSGLGNLGAKVSTSGTWRDYQ